MNSFSDKPLSLLWTATDEGRFICQAKPGGTGLELRLTGAFESCAQRQQVANELAAQLSREEWVIGLVSVLKVAPPRAFYAGCDTAPYANGLRQPAHANLATAARWPSREAAEMVAEHLLGTLSEKWVVMPVVAGNADLSAIHDEGASHVA